MIWSTPQYLLLSHRLRETPLKFEISGGVRVARGFADVGFEEFCVLGDGRMVSLYTGTIHDIDYEHIFVVPTLEDLLAVMPNESATSEIDLIQQILDRYNVKEPDRKLVACGE